MITVTPGHTYVLTHLKSEGTTKFRFYMDPALHHGRGQAGPSTQEVLRMCIDRVQHLDLEKPHEMNDQIIEHLRRALILFECRALHRLVDKGEQVEMIRPNSAGHIIGELP